MVFISLQPVINLRVTGQKDTKRRSTSRLYYVVSDKANVPCIVRLVLPMLLINFGVAARGGIRPIVINAASYLPRLTI
jgi:hypothetical protein